MMELQWKDNVKARVFNETQSNVFKLKAAGEKTVRSQDAIYDFWQDFGSGKKKK